MICILKKKKKKKITQTHTIDVEMIEDSIASVEVSKLESAIDMMNHNQFKNTDLESDDSSSEDVEEYDNGNAELSELSVIFLHNLSKLVFCF